jgi:ubiquinone/menaquinone biosynthesis C-methylase UbiE
VSEAHETWKGIGETLEQIEARIHDGAPPDQLLNRGRGYADAIARTAAIDKIPYDALCVEIGPGVGYIMQAFAEKTGVKQVTGLDIAEGMIEHARARLKRDGLSQEQFRFMLYDGVHFPFADSSVDFFYSVAAIQHVPKPFAYNIFAESCRCLRPGGTAVIHLLHWDHLKINPSPFLTEIHQQVSKSLGHWHHYYDEIEIRAVMQSLGTSPMIRVDSATIWFTWTN